MRIFTVSADFLNEWFAYVSPDCLDKAFYGYGDLRRMSAHEFFDHAKNVWGLYQLGYPIERDGYRFRIIDEETFRSWGLERYGVVTDEDGDD